MMSKEKVEKKSKYCLYACPFSPLTHLAYNVTDMGVCWGGAGGSSLAGCSVQLPWLQLTHWFFISENTLIE